MPLFMDIHYRIAGMTTEGMTEAHLQDMAVGAKYGVRWTGVWFNVENGRAYCMFEAPTPEAGENCHREAHGVLADEITEVKAG